MHYAHHICSSFHMRVYLLGSDDGVLLDGDLVVGLEGRDEVVWELGASAIVSMCYSEGVRGAV